MCCAAVFIDGQYLHAVARQYGAPNVDISKLGQFLASPDELLRVFLYHYVLPDLSAESGAEIPLSGQASPFVDAVRNSPRCVVRLGSTIHAGHDASSGKPIILHSGLGAQVATDIVGLSVRQRIRRAILVTNDEGWAYAADAARYEGVRVRLLYGSGRQHPSPTLWSSVDDHQLLALDCLLACSMLSRDRQQVPYRTSEPRWSPGRRLQSKGRTFKQRPASFKHGR
jgi:uncharacterized LabA/DUF88 family protein